MKLNLLILGPEINDPAEITSYGHVWSYFLGRTFRKMGHKVRFAPQMRNGCEADIINYHAELDLHGVDHILAVGTRYFSAIPNICVENLMSRCRGAVTQIHDGHSPAPVDCTFTVKRLEPARAKHCYIGWAADPELLKPNQPTDELRILVDHSDYVERDGDRTIELLEQAKIFAPLSKRPVRIRRIVDNGFIDIDEDEHRYSRGLCSYLKCCDEYSRAHLFMVTHPESVGLVVLETAMCGALPIAPNDYINADRLATVRHLCFGQTVPWEKALQQIDIEKSRAVAKANNWQAVAKRIVTWLARFHKR